MEHTNTLAWDGSVFYAAYAAMHFAKSRLRRDYLDFMDNTPNPYNIDTPLAVATYYAKRSQELHDAFNQHNWHHNLRSRFDLHPTVDYLVRRHRPHDWQQLFMEWPHVSQTDSTRLAYTRDERAGKEDRQTITSIGKYIKRHWPRLADHILRDAQALYTPEKIEHKTTDVRDYIVAVEMGPRSCMQSGYGTIPFKTEFDALKAWLGNPDNDEPEWSRHPYYVYDPKLGWGMVTRTDGDGTVMGRCLTWVNPRNSTHKVYVRSYARSSKGDASNSGSDHAIEAWLNDQGFSSEDGWPEGAKFSAIDHPHDSHPMMPYLDGGNSTWRRVRNDYIDGCEVMVRDDDGPYTCDCTDGTMTADEDDEDMTECEHCGERVYAEDTHSVGRHGDTCVCEYCWSNHYTEVRGEGSSFSYGTTRNRPWVNYRVHNDDAQPVYESYRDMARRNEVFYVDGDHVPEGVICTWGDGYGTDDAVVCCTDGEYYFHDDPNVVVLAEECPSSGENYATKDDAWQDADGEWHSDHVEYITYDSAKYVADDCWQCEGTGQWYPNSVVDEIYDDECNGPFGPDYMAPINRDASPIDEPVQLVTYTPTPLVDTPAEQAVLDELCDLPF